MALQEACGLYTVSSDSHRNASAMNHGSTVSAHEGDFISRRLRSGRNPNHMDFYVPVHEYLIENPIEFGQVHPDLYSPWTDEQTSHSLPSLSMNSPIALSVTPSVPLPFPLGHGTTTLGFVFQGGAIAAADSRSSCNGLVACPASQKILPVHSHLVGTTSGTSADCALWKRILSRELRLYQLRYKQRLSTGGAAKLLSHMLHPFKGTELCVAATLCGWDGEATEVRADTEQVECSEIETPLSISQTNQGESRTQKIPGLTCKSAPKPEDKSKMNRRFGPQLYYVCSDGLRLKGQLFSVGSGSPYAYSILDERIHWGVSVDEAVSIAREAVYRATYRDAYSGNNVDLYHVTAKGWRRRKREDLKEEYYREKKIEREAVERRRIKTDKA